MAPILVAALDHVALRCSGDVDALSLARWYASVLGFEPVSFDEFAAGAAPFPSVRVSPTCILDFFPGGAPGGERGAGGMDHVCFALAGRHELDGVVARLAAAGCAPEDAVPRPRSGARGEGLAVYAKDPCGTALEFRYYEG